MAKRRIQRPAPLIDRIRPYGPMIALGVVIIISVLFGVSTAQPAFEEGRIMEGTLTSLGYGCGAFFVVMVAYFLNRKMKGL